MCANCNLVSIAICNVYPNPGTKKDDPNHNNRRYNARLICCVEQKQMSLTVKHA